MPKSDPGTGFWSLIAPYTGAVSSVRHTERGFTSTLTAVVECENGPLFIKALELPSRDVVCFERESQINEHVSAVAPRLRWSTRTEDWYVLAFAYAPGRTADFAPGSADLAAVVDTVNRLSFLKCPPVASDRVEWRWDRFTGRPELFEGEDLLHTDVNPSDFVVQGDSAVLVDWAFPTRGAGFIDPACLVIQLIASGHTAVDAERWAAGCEAWNLAGPEAIDEFCAANLRLSEEVAWRDPAPWRIAMVRAGEAWATLRRSGGHG